MVAVPSNDKTDDEIPRVVCLSQIRSVVVYARGAVVTRRVDLPEGLPSSRLDLVVEAITPLAAPGSFRVDAEGSRDALGLITELEIPEDGELSEGELSRALDEARRAIADLEAERNRLEDRRRRFAQAVPTPALGKRRHLDAPDARVKNTLAAQQLLSNLAAGFDQRLVELDRALAERRRALERLQTEAAQHKGGAVQRRHHPEIKAVIRLSAGDGPIEALTLSYAVEEARWWPTYAVQLFDSARRAELLVDALVTQASFEDWSDVQISLCTADLIQDVRLPELTSLRLGRAQPSKRRGFRPPPGDLDQLFSGFDDAVAGAPPPPASIPPLLSQLSAGPPAPPADFAAVTKVERWDDEGAFDDEVTGAGVLYPKGRPAEEMSPAFSPQTMMMDGPPPMAPAMAMPAKARSGGPGAMLGGVLDAAAGGIAALAETEVMRFGKAGPTGIEPADAWLDFDSLQMGDVDDPTERGRLIRIEGRVEVVARLRAEVTMVDAPSPALRDPLVSRGTFDHRYEAEGSAEVLSNGRPHRISLSRQALEAKPRFVTVPRETPDVFREVELVNTLDAPLLAGPVDVMLDGALLTTTQIDEGVDRGGGFVVGLGVEERIRVARNSRVHESTVGMLSSSTAVDHEVTIDLVSRLGHPIAVELLERIPVTDDRSVEIELVESTPRAERYDQAERGRPVDGGLRWRVPLDPGAKRTVAYRYRIELPAKFEIVGGNRRE